MLVSRSERALAKDDSNSEGLCLDGLLGAILLRAAMIAGTTTVAAAASLSFRCRSLDDGGGRWLVDRTSKLILQLSFAGHFGVWDRDLGASLSI